MPGGGAWPMPPPGTNRAVVRARCSSRRFVGGGVLGRGALRESADRSQRSSAMLKNRAPSPPPPADGPPPEDGAEPKLASRPSSSPAGTTSARSPPSNTSTQGKIASGPSASNAPQHSLSLLRSASRNSHDGSAFPANSTVASAAAPPSLTAEKYRTHTAPPVNFDSFAASGMSPGPSTQRGSAGRATRPPRPGVLAGVRKAGKAAARVAHAVSLRNIVRLAKV
mmetsp:Transcript_23938/g.71961  ORF Transcript_23938/g.71961 Transcript_23938/m.71961 type:complete len:224 (-) Transcript_23938:87-758(-)